MFGSGPVRGFAVTMGLGIAISMFTAVSIVRGDHDRDRARRWQLKVLRIEPLFGIKLDSGRNDDPLHAAPAISASPFSAVLSLASIGLFIYARPQLRRRLQGRHPDGGA